ncbi:cytochrome P450 [Streptomyces vinaceus]|uniref:cytochrome P450 n=1 Tax=Streptomyces vinaceus TaxID=1960 RepID=UPI00367A3B97
MPPLHRTSCPDRHPPHGMTDHTTGPGASVRQPTPATTPGRAAGDQHPSSVAQPVPMPGGVPLVGHVLSLAASPLSFFERLGRFGPIVEIRLGRRRVWVLTDAELVRRVLVTDQGCFDKGGLLNEKIRIVAGNGLLTCSGQSHALQRPPLQPAFQHARLADHSKVMRDAALALTDDWLPGQTVDLGTEMRRLTAEVTARALITAPEGREAAQQIARSLPDILHGLYWRMLMPGRLFPRLPLPVNRRFDRESQRVRQSLNQVVEHYRTHPVAHTDMLATVISANAGHPTPGQAVYDQVVTFLMAGVETTAATIVWAQRMIGAHPHIAARLRRELHTVLDGALPDHEHLSALKFTRQILTETLRLYPPGWFLTRTAATDTALGETHVPAGTEILFSPYALHRNARVFPRPHTFDPDRWHPSRVTIQQRQGFFAFGAGRRKCIGDAFGMAAATLALAVINSRWNLRHPAAPHEAPLPRTVLMPPSTPVYVHPAASARA